MYLTFVIERKLEAEMKEPMMDPNAWWVFTVSLTIQILVGLGVCATVQRLALILVSFHSSPLPSQWYKLAICFYEARMWLRGCRTGVQCGLTWGTASVTAARTSMLRFFFFSPLTWLDLHQLSLIRTNLARIGPYQPNRVVSGGGRNRPKRASNHARTAKIGFEWGPNILNLSFLNFILNICYFFCVFFFVLCFLPSSFSVLWIKA